jgi:hypothetical protein
MIIFILSALGLLTVIGGSIRFGYVKGVQAGKDAVYAQLYAQQASGNVTNLTEEFKRLVGDDSKYFPKN